MKVEIWSDIACPWCYVGKRRFEEALRRFEHRDRVEVVWRSFELDPSARSAATVDEAPYAERLAGKYGVTVDEAHGMLDHMTSTAAELGLDLHFERTVAANTFDSHRLLHLAAEHGLQDALGERLFAAYLTDGAALGDREVLVRLAAEAGLDADDARAVLEEGRYADAVRADEAEAAALGISGVPFFVVDRRYGVSGAQPAETLLGVLERAWSESPALAMVGDGSAEDACGPDGCAL